MDKKIKYVSSPLTVIGIFAAMCETAFICAIKLVSPELQFVIILFAGLLAMLLVLLFFSTLIFKTKALYSPKDFKNEENFLIMMDIPIQKIKNKRDQYK